MREFKAEKVPCPKHFIPLDKLKPPFDLEIGCGSGAFALKWARQTKNPVIAIEKTRRRFAQLKKNLEKGPQNLWPIHTNAVWWLAHYAKKNSFQHIFLLYPNPYPKKKQAHLRWINRPFMPFLLDLLRLGGILELRTNKLYYQKEFKEKIKCFAFMRLQHSAVIQNPLRSQSLFEKKYLARGETCYALKYKKLSPS